ncbi:MAG TPA: methyltransferase domain-containing protein [Verrucomicrobiae bacterium]|jgi:23S rRNA G2445 N2-methylase RlmL
MKAEDRNRAKELYKELRQKSWPHLWREEVPRFNAASPEERIKTVAVIRAAGVVFAESGPVEEKASVREWLLQLLQDPSEKVRRYAMAAMPKIGAGAQEEQTLLASLRMAPREREKKYLARTLEKIGGAATLETGSFGGAEQKIKAGIARRETPSALRVNAILTPGSHLLIHLRSRNGLERFVSDEVAQRMRGKFRAAKVSAGKTGIIPCAPFSLADIYSMRCFGSLGFVLGKVEAGNEAESTEALAAVIASGPSRQLLEAFTEGAIRYRLNFVFKGHQRAAVDRLARQVYARCPEILNDPRSVTWTIDIYPDGGGQLVELRPNMTPDPRFAYRRRDVPAASHPPLAACLARLAGRLPDEVIWDPFCGSGSELIESALLGGARSVCGTDCSSDAIAIAQNNFAAAQAKSVRASFICGDFRKVAATKNFAGGRITLIITNPPMGMRVPVADLRGLIADLFSVSASVLNPGGRLVFVNPLARVTPPPSLKLQFAQEVDMGGFRCRLEKYLRTAAQTGK